MASTTQATDRGKKTTVTAKPVVWFEVVGKDGPGLQRFYSRLFDWQIADAGDDSGYGLVAAAEKGIGGGIGPTQDGGPGHVTFYVEVDDPAAVLARSEKLGGKTIMPPVELPQFHLTFALLADPEGHVIGLSKGAV
jgi:predicted enzyme related to lactoylglutathione lyase